MTILGDNAASVVSRAVPGDDVPPVRSTSASTASASQSREPRGSARVLLIVQGASWARDYLALAKALAATGRYEIEVGIGFAGPTAESFRQQCRQGGIRWFALDREGTTGEPTASIEPSNTPSKSAPRAGFRAVVKRIPLLRDILLVGYHILQFQKSRSKAVRLIAAHKPHVVVLSGYTGFEAAFLVEDAARRAASVLRLDSFGVITPAWRAAARDRLMGQRLAVSGLARKLLAAIFPQWTYQFADGRRMFYDAPAACIAAWICGVMPKNPFAPAHGPIAAFTAIHEYSRRVLEATGIEPGRIHLVGRLQDDVTFGLVAKAMNDKAGCLKALGLDPERPLILCSSAPMVEHNQMTVEEQLQYHETMLSELASIEGAQVALSFHPAQQDRDEIRAIAARHGARAFDAPGINELLPLAALYADGESTVAVVAAACGIPMIVVYLDKQVFPNGAPPPERREARFREYIASLRPPERFITDGMDFADGWKGVAALARRCLTDRAHHGTLVERQRRSARLWASAFDGKALERAVGLVDRLAVGYDENET